MTSKHCTKCHDLKPLSEFHKQQAKKDGCSSHCKPCSNESSRQCRHSKQGLITEIYYKQALRSKRRCHECQNYSLTELREWAFNQPIFHELYDNWVESGHRKDLIPSFDRKDDYQGYSLDRLQIMTWGENNAKGSADRKNGINNKDSSPIVQMNIDGSFVAGHYSMNQASRDTGIACTAICKCCRKRYLTAGGFRWMYSLGIPIANNSIGAR